MVDIDEWLARKDATIQCDHERRKKRALATIDKWEKEAYRHPGALNLWREAKIQDMRRYVNQYKFLPRSFVGLFRDWIYEAKTGYIRPGHINAEISWIPDYSKRQYLELIKCRGAHITDRP